MTLFRTVLLQMTALTLTFGAILFGFAMNTSGNVFISILLYTIAIFVITAISLVFGGWALRKRLRQRQYSNHYVFINGEKYQL